MNWFRIGLEVMVTLAWLYADYWLLTHPWVEVGGSPWILFGFVTWLGALFSWAASKVGRTSRS